MSDRIERLRLQLEWAEGAREDALRRLAALPGDASKRERLRAEAALEAADAAIADAKRRLAEAETAQ